MNILVAGVGNIFLGDDGFGVEVARELQALAWPPQVNVTDFGIRGYDLAFACTAGYDALVLVDAVSRGAAPGTVYVVEPDVEAVAHTERGAPDAHSLDPVAVLQMAEALGNRPGRVYLVGCEPADLGGDEGRMGLSDEVRPAVHEAARAVHALVTGLLDESTRCSDGRNIRPHSLPP